MKNSLLALYGSNRNRPGRRAELVRNQATGHHVLYLYDTIVATDAEADWYGGTSAQSLVPQLRAIAGGTIELRINSPGGDVFAAQAIAQALRDSSAAVTAHIDGLAASAATVIASAAGQVLMAEGAMYMVHRAWTIAVGNAVDMAAAANTLQAVDATLAKQYAKRTGKSEEEMLAMMDVETWMDATQSIEAGFADAMAGSDSEDDDEMIDALSSWDLSAYTKAPKPKATRPPVDEAAAAAAAAAALAAAKAIEAATHQAARSRAERLLSVIERA